VNWGQSYGEWAEPKDVCEFHWYDFASPHPEVSTAYTCWMLSLVLKIAEILGLPEDPFLDQVKRFEEGTKRAYQALRKTKAYPLDTDRQANLVRPLYLHLLEPNEEAYAKKRLVEALDHYDWRVGTGFLSTPFILYVLSDIDPDYAYRLLENEKEPGWLYMAIHNTGTVWEGWEGPNSQAGIASLNHYSKGAMVEWLFDSMAGIQIKQENEFVLKPIL
jgi:alpha-L-rhamnosidase